MFFEKSHPALRVLIVEDEPLIGMGLQDCLTEAGADAVWVKTDQAAYDALGAGRFDALILDVDLGHGTTGFDVARRARALSPPVGIIFSSGSPPDWMDTFGVEGALFVPKPCSAGAILAALDLVAERTQAA